MASPLARIIGLLALSTTIVLGTALPAAAYAPADAITVSSTTIDPGGTVRLQVQNGTFTPREALTITVRGENAAGASFALVQAATQTASHTAAANAGGGLDTVNVTFPSDASGAYTIAVFSATSPGGTVTVSVGSLSTTGLNPQSLLGLWIGGGALVGAGAIVLTAALVTRHRRALDAA